MVKIHKKRRLRLLIYVFLSGFFIISALKLLDSRIMPSAEQIGTNRASAYVNKKIDEITSEIIAEKNISYTDFYEKTENGGEISSITVNSLLVNEICQKTAANLSDELCRGESFKITLPLGLITGLKIFANSGPKIRVRLVSSGAVTADYETSLKEAGINRVNYQLYLNIKASMNLVCPLYNKPLGITRKYMLADTVFTGAVPDTYLNLPYGGNKDNQTLIPYLRGDNYADLQSEGG